MNPHSHASGIGLLGLGMGVKRRTTSLDPSAVMDVVPAGDVLGIGAIAGFDGGMYQFVGAIHVRDINIEPALVVCGAGPSLCQVVRS